eukprot:scaffold303_cov410-Prasinococcus_capsulatus_cf.AAC.10
MEGRGTKGTAGRGKHQRSKGRHVPTRRPDDRRATHRTECGVTPAHACVTERRDAHATRGRRFDDPCGPRE